MLGQGLLAALDALQDRHDRDAVQDRDLALAAQGLGQIGAGLIARVAVLGAHERVDRAVCVGIDRDHDHALILGHLHGRFHARAVGRVQQQDVDALLQHVLDVRDLLGHVMARVGYDDLGADLGGGLV